MFRRWAELSGGLLRDTPDAHNVVLAAMAAAASFFEASESRCGVNVQNYYHRARHHDWCTAQTILHDGADESEPRLELINIVGEGLIVTGTCRLSALAPLSEELLILPPGNLMEERFALAFAINSNARGLKLHCRDVNEVGRDRPLPGLFNEFGCVAVFDHVVIPRDRVFLCGDVARCKAMPSETGASIISRHQQAVRGIVANEFLLGSAATLAARCAALGFPRVRERLVEMIVVTHLARSLVRAAETAAESDRWGGWFPLAKPLDSATSLLEQVYNQSL
jgi:4-hydroxyphenylacetate 3-monooxygenase